MTLTSTVIFILGLFSSSTQTKMACFFVLFHSFFFFFKCLHFCKVNVTYGNGIALFIVLHDVVGDTAEKESGCGAHGIHSLNYLFRT